LDEKKNLISVNKKSKYSNFIQLKKHEPILIIQISSSNPLIPNFLLLILKIDSPQTNLFIPNSKIDSQKFLLLLLFDSPQTNPKRQTLAHSKRTRTIPLSKRVLASLKENGILARYVFTLPFVCYLFWNEKSLYCENEKREWFCKIQENWNWH
jgi:hypothetical protein